MTRLFSSLWDLVKAGAGAGKAGADLFDRCPKRVQSLAMAAVISGVGWGTFEAAKPAAVDQSALADTLAARMEPIIQDKVQNAVNPLRSDMAGLSSQMEGVKDFIITTPAFRQWYRQRQSDALAQRRAQERRRDDSILKANSFGNVPFGNGVPTNPNTWGVFAGGQ